MKAVDRFEVERGTAFSSFAVPTIVGELRRYFRDLGWAAHVPRGAQEMALAVERARLAFTSQHGVAPTVEQLAQHLEWSAEDVLVALEAGAAQHAVSLDAPCDRDGERATLAFGLIAVGVFHASSALGGASGITNIPYPQLGSLTISGTYSA